MNKKSSIDEHLIEFVSYVLKYFKKSILKKSKCSSSILHIVYHKLNKKVSYI